MKLKWPPLEKNLTIQCPLAAVLKCLSIDHDIEKFVSTSDEWNVGSPFFFSISAPVGTSRPLQGRWGPLVADWKAYVWMNGDIVVHEKGTQSASRVLVMNWPHLLRLFFCRSPFIDAEVRTRAGHSPPRWAWLWQLLHLNMQMSSPKVSKSWIFPRSIIDGPVLFWLRTRTTMKSRFGRLKMSRVGGDAVDSRKMLILLASDLKTWFTDWLQ